MSSQSCNQIRKTKMISLRSRIWATFISLFMLISYLVGCHSWTCLPSLTAKSSDSSACKETEIAGHQEAEACLFLLFTIQIMSLASSLDSDGQIGNSFILSHHHAPPFHMKWKERRMNLRKRWCVFAPDNLTPALECLHGTVALG